jgi:hypothetical protein
MLADLPAGEWLAWRRTLYSHGYSPLKQIDRTNVKSLRVARRAEPWMTHSAWSREPVKRPDPQLLPRLVIRSFAPSASGELSSAGGDLKALRSP